MPAAANEGQGSGTASGAPALSTAQRDWLLLLDAADHLYAAAALLEELARRQGVLAGSF